MRAKVTPEQLRIAEDLLVAADREFENGDALAGTQRLSAAITHTLTTIADAKGWDYDADDPYPVVKKLAARDVQVCDILEGMYLALKGHPTLVSAEYFRFEYGDTHRARRMAREFVDTVLALAAELDVSAVDLGGTMQKQLKTAQDYLDAADREFENADALAATEHLWSAVTQTLKTVADQHGWAYDADDLYPVVEKIAKIDVQVGEVLLANYFLAKSFPNKVHYGYFKMEDGDSHWALRLTTEFIDTVKNLSE